MDWKPPTKTVSEVNCTPIRNSAAAGIPRIQLPHRLVFRRPDFVLSAGRTAAMRTRLQGISAGERNALLHRIGKAETALVDVFLNKSGQFSFSDMVDGLADDHRSSLSGTVGAAVADLVMEDLGFHWRANARELKLQPGAGRPKTTRRPDFVYDPGAKMGFGRKQVVAVEAKGSIAVKKAGRSAIRRLAEKAYREQVRPYIEGSGTGVNVAGGFAVAFGAIPGHDFSTAAVVSPHVADQQTASHPGVRAHVQAYSLSAAATPHMQQMENVQQREQARDEEQMPMRMPSLGGGGVGDGGGGDRRREGERENPSGAVAFADYECAFQLCGALNASALLGRIVSGPDLDVADTEASYQDFRFFYGGEFLVGDEPYWDSGIVFAVHRPIAERILKAAAESAGGPPPTISLEAVPRETRAVVEEQGGAIHGDGLAIFRWFGLGADRVLRWDFRKGDWT